MLKATGIVRCIDDLGRVVIPMELRRTMEIGEREPMELFVNDRNDIILRKYAPGCTFCGTIDGDHVELNGKQACLECCKKLIGQPVRK